MKLATSNLVHNLGLESSLPRKKVEDQNWQESGLGSIYKMGTPLVIGATVDANNFKFGTQLRFVVQTMFRIKLGRVWTRGASKKIGTPYFVCNS